MLLVWGILVIVISYLFLLVKKIISVKRRNVTLLHNTPKSRQRYEK